MKILLAVDASAASEAAVEEVAKRTWPPGSCVDVITVTEPAHLWTTSQTAETAFQTAEDLLQSTLQKFQSRGMDAQGDILEGDPKSAILDRATETHCNLIVLGSHRASTVSHFLWGNVASNVLRHAPCSVLVARPAERTRRILLPTDGSPYSQRAACSLAKRPWTADIEFRVLSVLEVILPTTRVLFEPPFLQSHDLDSQRGDAMQHAQEAIAGAVTILQSTGRPVTESISVLTDGPKAIILNEAKEWGAQLIVLGSHGRQGSEHFLLGSVSEGVAEQAECSVEVIRGMEMPG